MILSSDFKIYIVLTQKAMSTDTLFQKSISMYQKLSVVHFTMVVNVSAKGHILQEKIK